MLLFDISTIWVVFFIPYAEVSLGFNLLSATYSYGTSFDNPRNNQDENKLSAAFTYGIGAGVMIKLLDMISLPATNVAMMLDLRMKYHKGTEAKYWRSQINNGVPEFREITSKTDLVYLQAGLAFRF